MKGNPAVPGGPLTSMPAWPNTSRCSATPVFFLARFGANFDHEQLRSDAARQQSLVGSETETGDFQCGCTICALGLGCPRSRNGAAAGRARPVVCGSAWSDWKTG